jgi:two-component system, cell cycle sensor histidine kinase and response regulator CckA
MNYIPEASSSNREAQAQRTVLVVEDERIMLRLLERFLSRQGYQVLLAADGEQAIDGYCRHKTEIDVVLLDVGLPKVSGVDVLRKMKKENPDVRVVVASGYLDAQMKTEMYRAGVKAFVDKPYMLPEMLETLRSVTER